MNARRLQRVLLVCLAAVPVTALAAQLSFEQPWWSRDQEGARLVRAGAHAEAAERFADPSWRAAALYRDGRFEDAAAIWGGVPGAEAAYNRGNALVFRGLYAEAVTAYERALELRPAWTEAQGNRRIAASRIRTETALGEASELGADDVVFDPNMAKNDGEQIEVTGGEALGDDELRALWLRSVKTEPGDFLRVKFAYQRAVAAREGAGEGER